MSFASLNRQRILWLLETAWFLWCKVEVPMLGYALDLVIVVFRYECMTFRRKICIHRNVFYMIQQRKICSYRTKIIFINRQHQILDRECGVLKCRKKVLLSLK